MYVKHAKDALTQGPRELMNMTGAKRKINRIVFWMPCVSPHMSELINAIVRLNPEIEVIACANSGVPGDRVEMGWESAPLVCFKEVVAPQIVLINEIVSTKLDSTMHILCGIRHVPMILDAISVIKRMRARFSILQEPRDSFGLMGYIRRLQSKITERWFRNNAEYIFAIGKNGPPWFTSVGYVASKVHWFAYYIPCQDVTIVRDVRHLDCNPIRICFIGRLVHMKGVDEIIKAAALLDEAEVHIVGNGPKSEDYRNLASRLGVNTVFHGVLPNKQILSFLAEMDVLILPSRRKDGWGVVVSEALMAGSIPIVSSNVGAAIVCNAKNIGCEIPDVSPATIARLIMECKKDGFMTIASRRERREFARHTLSPEAGAVRMIEILNNRI